MEKKKSQEPVRGKKNHKYYWEDESGGWLRCRRGREGLQGEMVAVVRIHKKKISSGEMRRENFKERGRAYGNRKKNLMGGGKDRKKSCAQETGNRGRPSGAQ